jgi:hypothetical protein
VWQYGVVRHVHEGQLLDINYDGGETSRCIPLQLLAQARIEASKSRISRFCKSSVTHMPCVLLARILVGGVRRSY